MGSYPSPISAIRCPFYSPPGQLSHGIIFFEIEACLMVRKNDLKMTIFGMFDPMLHDVMALLSIEGSSATCEALTWPISKYTDLIGLCRARSLSIR